MTDKLSLSRLDNVFNTLEHFVSKKALIRKVKQLLHLFILAAGVYGAYRGLTEALIVIRRRKPIRLTNKTLEPIINILVKVGILTIRPVLTALFTAAIAATAPISVPYIILICQTDEPKEPELRDDAEEMRTLK